jgi:hypothetical protein
MPRNAPDKVTEHRLTLGTFERSQIEPLLVEMRQAAKGAKVATWSAAIGAVAMPLAIASVGGAVALGLVGFGLDGNLDRQSIRDVILGTPSVRRTRKDGTEQEIENPFFGFPIIGPLFGTGMRIGEKTAEATTQTVTTVTTAVETAIQETAAAVEATVDYQDAILRQAAARGSQTASGASTIETQQRGNQGRGWSWASVLSGGWGGGL